MAFGIFVCGAIQAVYWLTFLALRMQIAHMKTQEQGANAKQPAAHQGRGNTDGSALHDEVATLKDQVPNCLQASAMKLTPPEDSCMCCIWICLTSSAMLATTPCAGLIAKSRALQTRCLLRSHKA